jgi:hypothetical protein
MVSNEPSVTELESGGQTRMAVAGTALVAVMVAALFAYLALTSDPEGGGAGESATTGPSTNGPGRFAAIRLAGSGDASPTFSIPEDVAAIAEITHDGEGSFAVRALGADDIQQLLISTTGAYHGTVLFDESEGVHSEAMQIEGDGAWTATIRPVPEARRWDQSGSLSGAGDDVILLEPATSGRKSVTIAYRGQSRFIVVSYASPGGGTLVDAVGSYVGVSVLDEGTFVLEIRAQGEWSLSPPR